MDCVAVRAGRLCLLAAKLLQTKLCAVELAALRRNRSESSRHQGPSLKRVGVAGPGVMMPDSKLLLLSSAYLIAGVC